MGATPTAHTMTYSMAWIETAADQADEAPPTPWEQALARLEKAGTYWLATVRPDGRPHVVPLLAVVVDGAVHFCAHDASRKMRNLAADPRCVITASEDSLDIVVEGEASAVRDEGALRRVAEAYGAKYGWLPEVRNGGLWADGAPTAGPPPYRVQVLTAVKAFGFPSDDGLVPTRWVFASPTRG